MIALTFLCGFVIEAVAVFWTHYAERGRGLPAAAFSVAQAAALLCLTDCTTWPLRVAFVAGYALGSIVAVRVKERFKRAPFSAEEFSAIRGAQGFSIIAHNSTIKNVRL